MKQLLAHPDVLRELRSELPPADKVGFEKFNWSQQLFGIELIEDRNIPKEAPIGKAVFPQDPFVEYEESDAEWAVPLGFAKREMVPVAYWLDRAAARMTLQIEEMAWDQCFERSIFSIAFSGISMPPMRLLSSACA